jgi:hypothetical protein
VGKDYNREGIKGEGFKISGVRLINIPQHPFTYEAALITMVLFLKLCERESFQ